MPDLNTCMTPILQTHQLSVAAGERQILRDINLCIPTKQLTAIIGPSGAGKSTLIKCFNRLVEYVPSIRVNGDVLFHGQSIYKPSVNADQLREKIGIIFQQPVVFPKSILQNVIFGVSRLGHIPKKQWHEVAEQALTDAALWTEVKDRLHEPALCLSVGQQQRLCIARTLAQCPEVILLDEPTSALDPKSTEAIEHAIENLKGRKTIILITHNLGQARRLADWVACISTRHGVGELVECDLCEALLTKPKSAEVIEFIKSRRREEQISPMMAS